MRPLAECLAAQDCSCMLVDWPGFGDSTRGRLGYGPQLYHHFLADFAAAVVPRGAAVIAAGHAASYALVLARDRPGVWSHAVLLAPTWRGPLPTAMGEHPRAYAWARRLVGTPVIGEALYRLNTLRSVIGLMHRRHVYSEAGQITPAFVEKKQHWRAGREHASGQWRLSPAILIRYQTAEPFLRCLTRRLCQFWFSAAMRRRPDRNRKWRRSPGSRASICAGSRERLACTRSAPRQLPTLSFASSEIPGRSGGATAASHPVTVVDL
jgi:pimeloyl-ACP methyl ester carboxylesterase